MENNTDRSTREDQFPVITVPSIYYTSHDQINIIKLKFAEWRIRQKCGIWAGFNKS